MNFKKTSRKLMSLVLAGCLSYSIVTPAITPAKAAEMSYSVMISPQYEAADQFSEGLAAVKKDGKWGYIDETGKTVIPFEYDYAYQFSEGLALVAIQGIENIESEYYNSEIANIDAFHRYCYLYIIDSNNDRTPLLVKENVNGNNYDLPAYTMSDILDETASSSNYPIYHNGYMYISALNMFIGNFIIDGNAVIDRNGNFINFGKKNIYSQFNEGLFCGSSDDYTPCYLDENGNAVITIDNEWLENISPFNQGLAPYCIFDENFQYSYGFIDKTGKTVIEPIYNNYYVIGPNSIYQIFNDNIASVENKNGLWGGIDKNGKTVIPFEYNFLYGYREGLAVAEKNGKYGVIDTSNNVVIPFEYDTLSGFNNGVCVAVKNGSAFCIDRYGNKIDGSDKINQETYFPNGDNKSFTFVPSEIIVTKENNLYGFARTTFTPDLPEQSEMDSWAYDEVVKSIEADLVPTSLQNQYKTNITRNDFATLVVTLLEQASGKDIDTLVKEETGKTISELVTSYPFTDTNSYNVIAANALGIINGKADGIFDPYANIKRQEAAALLMRVGKYLGKTDIENITTQFADSSSIQSYAVEAVNYVNALNVMNGTSDTTFSPNGTYTRQQAYITALRLYNAISE